MKSQDEKTSLRFDDAGVLFADVGLLRNCLTVLQELPKKIPAPPKQYIIYAEQLMGLNFLLVLFPEEILFVHENPNSLEYMKLIVELILLSEDHEEFISRIFSRNISDFLKRGAPFFPFSRMNLQKEMFAETGEALKKTLNEFTQWSYLASPVDETLKNDTLAKLSKEGRIRYEAFLLPRLEGQIRFENVRCNRLLPCWPVNEPIPFSPYAMMPQNIYGEMEPNTAAFYYGALWLNKKETFQAVKQKLQAAKLDFIPADLFKNGLPKEIGKEMPAAFYSSLLERQNRLFWLDFKERCKRGYRGQKGFLFLMTGNGETELFDNNATPSPVPGALQNALNFFGCEITEGHIQGEELEYFKRFLQKNASVKTIMEIGFNAGHSSELFLKSDGKREVHSFDIMEHDYGYIGKDFIDYAFPGRHRLIIGDSRSAVPKFSRENQKTRFDLIFIDGCHEEDFAWEDIVNCRQLAHQGTWVLIDDIASETGRKKNAWSVGPTKAWNRAIVSGLIVEAERICLEDRGWAIGKYLF